MTLSTLLAQKDPVFLDGAMGTELHRLGVDIGLPLWSANALLHAPHVVRNIHFFYLEAGADILTTNTFRTNPRTLFRKGYSAQWEELNLKSVEFAFEARDRYRSDRPVAVAGGLAPVEDCYSPGLVPPDAELREEHGMQAACLAEAGVDILLAETMLSIREARIAAEACAATGKEFAVSFVCGNDGALLSGEPLAEAVSAVEAFHPAALLVNCVNARHMHIALGRLRSATDRPFGCYANVGTPVADGTHMRAEVSLDEYVDCAETWRALGARILGGCCGTTPETIAALVRRFSPAASEEMSPT